MNSMGDFLGDFGGATVGSGGESAGDGFADDEDIGRDGVFASVAAGAGTNGVSFVHDEKSAVAAGDFGCGLPIPGIGMDDSDIRHHRFGEDAGHVSGLKGGFATSEVVALNESRGLDGFHRRADVAAARSGFSFDERYETLVHAAVVAIVIDEDFRPRRDFARSA